MPLHDWNELTGWEGVHHLWISELLYWVKPRLPPGYRAFVGTAPAFAIGSPPEKPDVGVRSWRGEEGENGASGATPAAAQGDKTEPDIEVAVVRVDPEAALFVEQQGRLIAAVELVSPRNKDRPSSRETYLARYVGYILRGVNLVLVDVHPRPRGFSFADGLAAELQLGQEPLPPPCALAYRVGETAATGGRLVALWRRQLTVGTALPSIPLPLSVQVEVSLDLEATYREAASGNYLD